MLPKRLKYYQCYKGVSYADIQKYGSYQNALHAKNEAKAAKKAYQRQMTAAIIGSVFAAGTTVAVAAIKSNQAAAAENQQKTAATTQTLNNYQTACATINTIGESGGTGTLGQAEKELEALQKDLKLATDDDEKTKALEEQDNKQQALNEEAGITDSNKKTAEQNVAKYNELQQQKSTLTSLAQQYPTLDKNINDATVRVSDAKTGVTNAENAYSSATFMKSGITVTKGNAVAAVVGGGYTDVEKNTGKYSTDLKTAQNLDNAYNAALQEQNDADAALNAAKQAKSDALQGAGITGIGADSTLEQINRKLDEVDEDLTEFGNGSVTDVNSDSGMSVQDYAAKSANISKEKERINKLSKSEIETKIKLKEDEIAKLESNLKAAQKTKTELEPEVQKIGTSAQAAYTSAGNLATEQAQFKDSKKYGADGQRRTFLQRMFGGNRDKTNIKQQRAEYREAKANASAAASAYSSDYGTLTEEQKEYLAQLGYKTSD